MSDYHGDFDDAPHATFRCRECDADVPAEEGGDGAECSDCWTAADPKRAADAEALCRRLGRMARGGV